jgi:two-component system chemotaxis sensor kinase CheA
MSDQVSDKDEMKEIIDEFIVEAYDLAEKAIQDIIAIENNSDDEIINSIFRAVHTIKGTSSFLGFGTLSTLAHRSEDILGMVRKGNLKPDREVADVLLEALDLIKTLLDDIKESGAEAADTSATIAKLEELAKPDRKKLGEILVEENIVSTGELTEALKKQEGQQDKRLGEILVEEKVITDGQLKDVLSKQKTHKEEQTIRIEVKKLDELMNLAGELVLGKNRLILLNSLVKKSEAKNGVLDNLADVTNYIEMVTNELQLSVMRARLVPISKLFNKIPRLARDLSAEFKKEIDLTMEGEETELDRSLIESLHDPLIHIIRNSADHGIETPEIRSAAGKNDTGTIHIDASRSGSMVAITISDDGAGLNLGRIRQKALEKGVVSPEAMETMTDQDIYQLIFEAGFSTADKVTDISGRGVGMDFVKRVVTEFRGYTTVDSTFGKGTKIIIYLPLKSSVLQTLLVRSLP